jgi:hypothetical protein
MPIDDYAPRTVPQICEPIFDDERLRVERPGVFAFRAMVLDAFGGRDLGVARQCDDEPSSAHHESRAWDWGPEQLTAVELWQANANALRDWLLETDADGNEHARARRFGIRNIILMRKIWSGGTLGPYLGSSPHTAHMHIDFGWDGAKGLTSGYGDAGVEDRPSALPLDRGSRSDSDCPVADDEEQDVRQIIAVRGIEETTEAFRRKLLDVADALGIDVDHLAAVISFESAGTFDPTITNKQSGAVGLIQFTSVAAAEIGTTQAQLAAMSAIEQLDAVRAYYERVRELFPSSPIETATDVYLAVFSPAFIGAPDERVMYSQFSDNPKKRRAYEQNKALDINGDGSITVAEVSAVFHSVIAEGMLRPPVEVKRSVRSRAALTGVMLAFGLGLVLAVGEWNKRR